MLKEWSRESAFGHSFMRSPPSNGLAGFVLNNSNGVLIEVEGDCTALDRFLKELEEQAPPQTLDTIKSSVITIPSLGQKSFHHRAEPGGRRTPGVHSRGQSDM